MLSLRINISLEHFSKDRQLVQVRYPTRNKDVDDFVGKKSLQMIDEFFTDFGSAIAMSSQENDSIGIMVDSEWNLQEFATIVCLINNIRTGTGKFKDLGYIYTVIKFLVDEIEWITPDGLGYKEIKLSELPYDEVYPKSYFGDLLRF